MTKSAAKVLGLGLTTTGAERAEGRGSSEGRHTVAHHQGPSAKQAGPRWRDRWIVLPSSTTIEKQRIAIYSFLMRRLIHDKLLAGRDCTRGVWAVEFGARRGKRLERRKHLL